MTRTNRQNLNNVTGFIKLFIFLIKRKEITKIGKNYLSTDKTKCMYSARIKL